MEFDAIDDDVLLVELFEDGWIAVQEALLTHAGLAVTDAVTGPNWTISRGVLVQLYRRLFCRQSSRGFGGTF